MILQTKRLDLRKLVPSDARHFFNLNSDPDVMRYTGDQPFSDEQAARRFLENYPSGNYEKYGYGRWAVLLQDTGEWIGWCGLKYHPDDGETDIGYRFFKKYWGRGYATEAARACVVWGFETAKLKRIIGKAMTDNTASITVLEKVGMYFEMEILFDGKTPGQQWVINAPGQ